MKLYILPLFLALLFAGGCSRDPAIPPDGGEEAAALRIRVSTPGRSGSVSRAADEDLLSEVNVLVLENTAGAGYTYRYTVIGYSLTAASASESYDYQFLARLLPATDPVRLYIVGNGGNAIDGLTEGMTEAEVAGAVTMPYTGAGFTSTLPMTGIVDLSSGLSAEATVDAVLVRSVARVDVVNAAANFTLTSVRVYRANDQVQLIPDDLPADTTLPAASVPPGAAQDVDTDSFPVTANTVTSQIYIPESKIPAAGDRRLGATAVVVGGLYDGSNVPTYYRMDFDPDDDTSQALFGQVLRNHIYRFEITDVHAPGWATDDQASVNPSTGVDVALKEWDQVTMYMVFDEYDYFGVSARSVRLAYAAGSTGAIQVDTSLDTYTAYWSDADGNIIDSDAFITPGGDFDDPDGLYNATINPSGTEITFTSLAPYDSGTTGTRYLLIEAGRLRVLLSVTQGAASYQNGAVSVFGSNSSDIGRMGTFVTGSGWNPLPGSRVYGLGNMLVGSLTYGPQNFGPGKTVDMDGIYITGFNLSNTMPRNYYQGSDVLYLSFDNSPTADQSQTILDWLEEDSHRVLIVQFDNTNTANTSGTNYTMMASLGLNRIPGGNVQPYDYAGTDTPDFIRYGPFGTLPDSFTYKCYDDTYEGISPSDAAAAGFLPILLTGTASTNPGNYLLSINPDRRIILSGDCDLYGNNSGGSAGYYLTLTESSAATLTVDPDNPAQVLMGNLWAWIVDVVLREQ
ncbi:MAG: hypothetical protein LUE10_01075 [Alistipes sp.]|nr:hypothetical protein [Alistipes sp.]